mmetsp:Transcript_32446/g.91942  ORF Transcript_32446/g.91942 Transcript_32446/m.91942 type:complete len:309 (+) Transcript_32446:300-1226(+)
MGPQVLVQELLGELSCQLCRQLYRDPHVVPICGHTFCRDCIHGVLEGPGITQSQCPVCRKPVWKRELVRNHKYANLVVIAASLKAFGAGNSHEAPAPSSTAEAGVQDAEGGWELCRATTAHDLPKPAPEDGGFPAQAFPQGPEARCPGLQHADSREGAAAVKPEDPADQHGGALQPRRLGGSPPHQEAQQPDSEHLAREGVRGLYSPRAKDPTAAHVVAAWGEELQSLPSFNFGGADRARLQVQPSKSTLPSCLSMSSELCIGRKQAPVFAPLQVPVRAPSKSWWAVQQLNLGCGCLSRCVPLFQRTC